MKKLILVVMAVTFAFNLSFASGKHLGELKNLDIEVVYLSPLFYTADGYAGYYIGQPMSYELRIKNNSPRAYKHLDISATQEYHENKTCDRWWYPHPRTVTVNKGQPMPGNSTFSWDDLSITGNQQIVLTGTYTAPMETCDGLDQTRIRIKHRNQGKVTAAEFVNEILGVYCPPPPK